MRSTKRKMTERRARDGQASAHPASFFAPCARLSVRMGCTAIVPMPDKSARQLMAAALLAREEVCNRIVPR